MCTGADPGPVIAWVEQLGYEVTLNVAGPRESRAPGLYQVTLVLLDRVLSRGQLTGPAIGNA